MKNKLKSAAFAWIGAFVGIGMLSYLQQFYLEPADMVMIVGSFGASAVLLYSAWKSPLAQPRNLLGGHIISAIIGVSCYQFIPLEPWAQAAIAVATAIAVMELTITTHPPGGATSLIAVIGSSAVHDLGYLYVLIPIAAGAFLMLMVALAMNWIDRKRSYPVKWV